MAEQGLLGDMDEESQVVTVGTAAWERILAEVRQDVGDQRFNMWFRNTRLVTADDSKLQIGVPNLFIKGWLEENFTDTVRACANRVCDWQGQVGFTVAGDLFRQMRSEQIADGMADIEVSTGRAPQPTAPQQPQGRRLTLDDFITGPCNQLAKAAALEVCSPLQPTFTRLFIHGGLGLGKTHIVQGIWNKMRDAMPQGEVVSTTAERWTNQYIYSLKSGQLDAFRQKFRNVKILLIDDVHFLKNKRGIQEEFLHTFDALEASNKRIVMASDSHPRDLVEVTSNLITRFLSGMIVKLDSPDYDTRVRILLKKASNGKWRFPIEVLELIADTVSTNVRELEGAMITVVAYAGLCEKPITIGLARDALAETVHATSPIVTLKQIEDEVIAALGVSKTEIHSKRRTRAISRARHVCMFLARQLTDKSYRDIAEYFGGLKHASVVSACKNVTSRMKDDAELAALVDKLTRRIQK